MVLLTRSRFTWLLLSVAVVPLLCLVPQRYFDTTFSLLLSQDQKQVQNQRVSVMTEYFNQAKQWLLGGTYFEKQNQAGTTVGSSLETNKRRENALSTSTAGSSNQKVRTAFFPFFSDLVPSANSSVFLLLSTHLSSHLSLNSHLSFSLSLSLSLSLSVLIRLNTELTS